MQKNGEDNYVDDDPNYVVTDVPENDIDDNETDGSNQNYQGYDVGIHDDHEDEDEYDDGIHWCYYWDCGCFFLSSCY